MMLSEMECSRDMVSSSAQCHILHLQKLFTARLEKVYMEACLGHPYFVHFLPSITNRIQSA